MVRYYKRKTEDQWTKVDLLEALTNIKEGNIKINDAATHYRISRATLYRQYKKFLQAGGKFDVDQLKTGRGHPILSKVQEDDLEKTIADLRKRGNTVSSTDIKRICFEYCDTNGISNQFNQEKRLASDYWYYGFLNRHPKVRTAGDGTIIPEFVPNRKTKKKKAKYEEMDVMEVKTDEQRSSTIDGGGGDIDVVSGGSGSSSTTAVSDAPTDSTKGVKASPNKSLLKIKASDSLECASAKKKVTFNETVKVRQYIRQVADEESDDDYGESSETDPSSTEEDEVDDDREEGVVMRMREQIEKNETTKMISKRTNNLPNKSIL